MQEDIVQDDDPNNMYDMAEGRNIEEEERTETHGSSKSLTLKEKIQEIRSVQKQMPGMLTSILEVINDRFPPKSNIEKQSQESLQKNVPPSRSLKLLDKEVDIDKIVKYAINHEKEDADQDGKGKEKEKEKNEQDDENEEKESSEEEEQEGARDKVEEKANEDEIVSIVRQ
ncbi:cilia- and flagella-associated protein 251-like [Momordica charantia]|uniref:Cilia- and flagella-associated protein 251-like n=1 Tax=Momordica charantia TaxID=3673 RepID=A0A6J1DUB5_MOMCH|nr:cilia- and flagella-associated protein 251-like [Momordica charantia]